jgi:thioesterase domain-containing protein
MEGQLQKYLHEHIPISVEMGIEVLAASPERVLLGCPLAPNVNHNGTAFGGSIGALATLAGWSWIWIMMREHAVVPKLLIRRSSIEYLAPATESFTAELRPPSDIAIQAFTDSYDRRGSGRIELRVDVLSRGEIVANFTGTYVAQKS